MKIPANSFNYAPIDSAEVGSLILSDSRLYLRVEGAEGLSSFAGLLELSGQSKGNIRPIPSSHGLCLNTLYGWRPMIESLEGGKQTKRHGVLFLGPNGPVFWGRSTDAKVGVYGIDGKHDTSHPDALADGFGIEEWSIEIFEEKDRRTTYSVDLPSSYDLASAL